MNRGRKLFYNPSTGEIFFELGEGIGLVSTTINQDIATFTALSERNRDTFDVIELAYGQLTQDFAECNGYSVDVVTKELVFSYPDPSNPEMPITQTKPLSVQIAELQDTQKTADDKYKEVDLTTTTLEALRTAKIAQLKEQCSDAIYAGFTSASLGHTFGFNGNDQANFTQQLLLIALGDTSDIEWKTVDAGVITATSAQFRILMGEAKDHKLAKQTQYWNLEQQVLTATTNEAIDAVSWASTSTVTHTTETPETTTNPVTTPA